MTNFSKEEILASSKGWIASFLNFLPGLGTGYIYQRRWIPYFITLGIVSAWLVIGFIIQDGKELTQTQQFIGLVGLTLISIVTVIEAYLTYKKAANNLKLKIESKTPIKKTWFK